MTVPDESSRLESHAEAELLDATAHQLRTVRSCGQKHSLETPGFRYPPIHANGAAWSLSNGTLHARSSLNGTSHPTISLDSIGLSNEPTGGTVISGALAPPDFGTKPPYVLLRTRQTIGTIVIVADRS